MMNSKITQAMAAAGIVTLGVCVVLPTLAGLNDDTKYFDPLFVNGKACGPVQAGVPPLLSHSFSPRRKRRRFSPASARRISPWRKRRRCSRIWVDCISGSARRMRGHKRILIRVSD